MSSVVERGEHVHHFKHVPIGEVLESAPNPRRQRSTRSRKPLKLYEIRREDEFTILGCREHQEVAERLFWAYCRHDQLLDGRSRESRNQHDAASAENGRDEEGRSEIRSSFRKG